MRGGAASTPGGPAGAGAGEPGGFPVHGGEVHPSYAGERPEVVALVPPRARRVLDVGASSGALGAALKARGCEVTGIEGSPSLARRAAERLDRVVEGDVEVLAREGADPGSPYDCVVMADVLEHLRDPWAVTRWAAGLVGDGGSMVVSVPNVRHAQLLWFVVLGRRWPRHDFGIFDRSHLRWFAHGNLPELLEGTGFAITELTRTHWLTWGDSRLNRLAGRFGDFGTLQFVFRAERTPPEGRPTPPEGAHAPPPRRAARLLGRPRRGC